MCTLQSKVLVKVKQADVCGSAQSTGEHVPGRERPPPLGPCLLHLMAGAQAITLGQPTLPPWTMEHAHWFFTLSLPGQKEKQLRF